MRTALPVLLASLLAFIGNYSFAQKIPFYDVRGIIDRADVLYDSGKYAESITLLKTIPVRDTAYMKSMTSLAYSLIDGEKYDEALEVCRRMAKDPSETRSNFLRLEAQTLDKKGDRDGAITVLQKAVSEYPGDANLIALLGLYHYNKKDYPKAEDYFFKAITINPFQQTAHLNLARLAIGQGHKTHAMLAMGIYLAVNESDNAHLVFLNNFVDNQVQEEGVIPEFANNSAAKLDQIIRARMVGEEGFKSVFPVKAPVIQQYELLFDQLGTIASDSDDPYVKYYMPVYNTIKDLGAMQAFVYHILSSSSIEAAAKWRNKNEKGLNAFFGATNTALAAHRSTLTIESLGFKEPVMAWFYTSNQLEAVGNRVHEKRTGRWMFFHTNGERQAEGAYNSSGVKTGTWKYYHSNGRVKSIENYETGEVTVYSEKGNRAEHFFLKNGEIEGVAELFYEGGPLREKVTLAAGKKEGKRELYFHDGTVKASYFYKADQANGDYFINYENGNISERGNLMNGDLHGKFESFHANGKRSEQGQFANDNRVGLWKYYYSNGRLRRTGSYTNEGKPTGEWTYYDLRGHLSEKRRFDSDGRLEGEYNYYDEGRLYCTSSYKKDVLVKDVFYGPNGKAISTSGGKDGTFYSMNYFSTGQLRSEGRYVKGKNEGPWKFYNRFGALTGEYTYKEGELHGFMKDFYPSGELKVEAEYKDGKLDGYYQEYYRHGQLKDEGWCRDGNREQQWRSYHPDGTLESDYYYLQGRLVGTGYVYSVDGKKNLEIESDTEGNVVDLRFFDSKGKQSSKSRFENLNTVFQDYTPGNKLRVRTQVRCGDYTGPYESFYPNGSVMTRYEFVNGKRNGNYVYKELNGLTTSEGAYNNGERTGRWLSHYEHGALYSDGTYLENDRDSVWVYLHDNGKVSSRGWYLGDKRHGVTTYYGPDAEPVVQKRFQHGDLIAYRPMTNPADSAWRPVTGNEKIEIKYANGMPAMREEYKNGLLHGSDLLYYNNGQVYKETRYQNGDLHGEAKSYYPNGKLKTSGAYQNDNREGLFQRFDENGSVMFSETFRMGYQNGKSVVYEKGVKKNEVEFWYGIVQN